MKSRSVVLFLATALLAAAQTQVARVGSMPPPTEPSAIHVHEGFKVELVYTVPNAQQGSWVALTVDAKGRLIAGDQYGGLYRLTLPRPGSAGDPKVEQLNVVLTDPAHPPSTPPDGTAKKSPKGPLRQVEVGAHGLLYAFDSLYVMNNERSENHGLWRLRDTDGDDQFDEVKFLREMNGRGEHGPHSLALSPDGRSIYFINGNHTDIPNAMESSRPVAWGEDHILPQMWAERGKSAPGGYIGRTDPDGKVIEFVAMGYRNPFDFAFDQNGELFTFDSDNEPDQGTPWYVPPRINHVVDGGDYGWRNGAGRWPAYYADSLPAVVDIGPGSPTGVTFGTHANFPAKYQRALFGADWTYGTLYAIHLTADGATFRGEKEEFITGRPLPLTDVVINPRDGAMYFAVGGRRTQSALYRVTYTGSENTSPATIPPPTPEATLRHTLEALHGQGVGPEATDLAWPHLASSDRFVRFAARVAIEHQLPLNWAERALTERNPQAAIEALIALARVGEKSYQPRIFDALGRLDFTKISAGLRLPLLRAWELAFSRMGRPDAATCTQLAKMFDPLFPHANRDVNRELLALLVYLDSPTVVAKTVPLLSVSEPMVVTPEELGGKGLLARNDVYGEVVAGAAAHRADRQQIAYAYTLRNATVGWTPKLRLEYYSWFPRTTNWKGGAIFRDSIQKIRTDSLANVADLAERAALDTLSKPPPPKFLVGAVSPRGPGQAYTVDSAIAVVPAKLSGRDFAHGKAMFQASACLICHQFNGEGGGIGPDLSAAGSRYSVRDFLFNIIEPSAVISEQWGSEQIERTDGSMLVGRVVGEENGDLLVMANPFAPEEKTKVSTAGVKARKPNPISMMPPGLINSLNPDELKDLVAYVLAGGNADDPVFKR